MGTAIITVKTVDGNKTAQCLVTANCAHKPVLVKGFAATCTENGRKDYYACHCGKWFVDAAGKTEILDTRSVILPTLGHIEVIDKAVAATCTEAGKTEGKHCSVCNAVLVKQEVVSALGHSWNSGVVTTQPTENSEGVRTYTCTRCKETKTESIPKLDHTHSYTAKVTAPTCTEKGYTTHTCTCGDSYIDTYTNALGHAYGDWKAVNSTTERRECSRCDAYEERKITAETDAKIVVSQVTARAGETVDVQVSMANNPGINTMTLNIVYDTAKLTLNKVTPAPELGGTFQYSDRTHAIVWQASSDTTHSGTILTLSFTLAEDLDAEEIPVTITYKPGNICNYDEEDVDFTIIPGGITVQTYTPGDINGDGTVNNKDLNRLMKYLIDDTTEVVADALDVNGDGTVNNKDLNRLMKYLLDDTTEIF